MFPQGLRVIFRPIPLDFPIVHIILAIEFGSSDDGDRFGLAHLIEHIIVRHYLADVPEVQAATGRDRTTFKITVREDKFPSIVSRLLNVLHPLEYIGRQVLFEERKIVEQEINERRNTMSWQTREDMLTLIWKGTTYAHSSLGSAFSLSTITPSTVIDTQRLFYRVSNAVLIIVASERVKQRYITFEEPCSLDNRETGLHLPTVPIMMPFRSLQNKGVTSILFWHDKVPHVILPQLVNGFRMLRIAHIPILGGWLNWARVSGTDDLVSVLTDRIEYLASEYAKDSFLSDHFFNRIFLQQKRRNESFEYVGQEALNELWTGDESRSDIESLDASIEGWRTSVRSLIEG